MGFFFKILWPSQNISTLKLQMINLKRSFPLCPISLNIFPTMVAGLIIKTDILLFLTHPGATAQPTSG